MTRRKAFRFVAAGVVALAISAACIVVLIARMLMAGAQAFVTAAPFMGITP